MFGHLLVCVQSHINFQGVWVVVFLYTFEGIFLSQMVHCAVFLWTDETHFMLRFPSSIVMSSYARAVLAQFTY